MVSNNYKLLVKFNCGTLNIIDTMRLMSLFLIISRTSIGIRVKPHFSDKTRHQTTFSVHGVCATSNQTILLFIKTILREKYNRRKNSLNTNLELIKERFIVQRNFMFVERMNYFTLKIDDISLKQKA